MTMTPVRRAASWRATWLLGAALAVAAPAQALTIVEPGLTVTTFATTPAVSLALPGPAARDYGSFLYTLARTESPRIDDLVEFDRTGSELRRGVIALDAAVLQFGSGAFTGRLFAADRGLPTSVPDGIHEIRPDRSVVLFSNLGGGNPDPAGMAFGRGGSWSTFMYVANPTAGSNDARVNRAIVRLNSSGDIVDQLATHPDGPWYLALPDNASIPEYGDWMYFTLLSSNRVMRVDAAGNIQTFATFEAAESPVDLVFGRGGALGHHLYVTVQNTADAAARRLVRVRGDGTIETIGTGLRGFNLGVDPDSGDLFVGNEGGGILRISGVATDAPRIGFLDSFQQVSEGAGSVEIRVRRTGGSGIPTSVDFATRDITATAGTDASNGDYRAASGTLTFTAPDEVQTIEVEIFDDTLREGAEEFAIDLSNPTGGATAGTLASVLILDNDGDFDLGLSLFEIVGRDSRATPLGEGRYRIDYYIRMASNGPGVSPPRTVQVSIPDEIFELISAESRLVTAGGLGLGPTVGGYLPGSDIWALPELLPGQQVELHLTVVHALRGASGRFVTMSARILTNTGDTNATNDVLTVTRPVGGLDLAVDVTTDPGPRSPYDFIAFDVGLRRVPQNNVNPWVYPTSVVLLLEVASAGDEPQPNTRFLPERTTGVTCTAEDENRRLRCPVNIGPEAQFLPIAVRVEASPEAGRELRVTATLQSDVFDPNPDNNGALASVAISNAFFDGDGRQPFDKNCDDSSRLAGQCGNLSYLWCFIATAAYGSGLDLHVASLRQFRDTHLLTHAPGRAFVRWYYDVSPPIAAWIAEREWARAVVRGLLWPIVATIERPAAAGASVLLLLGGAGFLLRRRRHVATEGRS